MIHFKSFILAEGKSFDVDKFYADCEPFIQKLHGIKEKYLPKHGSKIAPRMWEMWEIRRVARREKPRDMPVELHNAIDDYFEARFGWRARSESIFTTGDYEMAKEYGTAVLCFPIGENYQTLWSEDIKDLYNWLYYKKNVFHDKYGWPIYIVKDVMAKMMPSIIEKTITELEKEHWHYNEMIKEGYESGNEVLINADKVYLIRMSGWSWRGNIYQVVIDYLKSLKLITD